MIASILSVTAFAVDPHEEAHIQSELRLEIGKKISGAGYTVQNVGYLSFTRSKPTVTADIPARGNRYISFDVQVNRGATVSTVNMRCGYRIAKLIGRGNHVLSNCRLRGAIPAAVRSALDGEDLTLQETPAREAVAIGNTKRQGQGDSGGGVASQTPVHVEVAE